MKRKTLNRDKKGGDNKYAGCRSKGRIDVKLTRSGSGMNGLQNLESTAHITGVNIPLRGHEVNERGSFQWIDELILQRIMYIVWLTFQAALLSVSVHCS